MVTCFTFISTETVHPSWIKSHARHQGVRCRTRELLYIMTSTTWHCLSVLHHNGGWNVNTCIFFTKVARFSKGLNLYIADSSVLMPSSDHSWLLQPLTQPCGELGWVAEPVNMIWLLQWELTVLPPCLGWHTSLECHWKDHSLTRNAAGTWAVQEHMLLTSACEEFMQWELHSSVLVNLAHLLKTPVNILWNFGNSQPTYTTQNFCGWFRIGFLVHVLKDPSPWMCAPILYQEFKYLGLQSLQKSFIYNQTLMCENYSMSREFNSSHPKVNQDIRVAGIIEKALKQSASIWWKH